MSQVKSLTLTSIVPTARLSLQMTKVRQKKYSKGTPKGVREDLRRIR